MSLHHNRQPHAVVYACQTASVAIRFVVNSTDVLAHPSDPANVFSHALQQDEHSEQHIFELDQDEEVHDSTDISFSLPHDMLLPVCLRRGMVLMSNSSWSGSYSDVIISTSLPFKLPHIVSANPTAGVAWTVEVELVHRLSIFPGVNCTPAVLPPIPLLKQRVALYAGCVTQPAVVVSEAKSAEDIVRFRVRFARYPEYLEVGRQLILTWTSCAKAVGRVSALFELVPIQIPTGQGACWINSHGQLEHTADAMDEQSVTDDALLFPLLSEVSNEKLSAPILPVPVEEKDEQNVDMGCDESYVEEKANSSLQESVSLELAVSTVVESAPPLKCDPQLCLDVDEVDGTHNRTSISAVNISDIDPSSSSQTPADPDKRQSVVRRSSNWRRRRRRRKH